jgi:prepilin-type N-terminal cleavage/methylation domain-containing protein
MPKQAGHNRTGRRGFTLMEMIVATFLLAVGVAGALGAFASATRATAAADHLNTAASAAAARRWELSSYRSSARLTGCE